MKRLTAERCNGIKTGYWSPVKKEELVQRLGEYEDTGFAPEEIKDLNDFEKTRCARLMEKYAGITLCSECGYHAVEKSTGIHWCRMSLGLDGELNPGDSCSRGKAVDDGQGYKTGYAPE